MINSFLLPFLFIPFLILINAEASDGNSINSNGDEYEYDVIRLDTWSPTSNDDGVIIFDNNKTHNIETDHCLNVNLPPCERKEPRDIIFMLDASNSVDRDDFYTKTLNATRDLICAFDPNAKNQYGLILFNSEVKEVIKLAPYSHQEWAAQIERVRKDPKICCTCCTPLAEAFELSAQVLKERGINSWSIVFAQTDGIPYQNSGKGSGKYRYPLMNSGIYAIEQVPKSALILKQLGTRLMIVGVKTRTKGNPNCDYFKGIPSKTLNRGHDNKYIQCIERTGADSINCVEMKKPPFPIVSEPIEKNSFCLSSIDDILIETVTSICLPPLPRAPTLRPTPRPSNSPTTSPTPRPSVSPTPTPSNSPSTAPTPKPTDSPTTVPTRRPTESPTTSPTRSPTLSPTPKPTNDPTLDPTRSPTNTPTTDPTNHPTLKPTKNPTFKPTRSPTIAPTSLSPTASPTPKPKFDSLDLYFILDRSGSMGDYYQFCSKVSRRSYFEPEVPEKSCWGILLDFVETLALEATNIGTERPMNWKSDWPSTMNNVGLRVTVIAFSCSQDLKTPITNVILDKADSYQALQDGLIKGFQRLSVNGGTCPSEAIDTVVTMIEDTDHVSRPFTALVYLSDGITSSANEDKTVAATRGLRHFDVSTFVVGIAVPRDSKTFGLTLEEQAKQKSQLLAIAGNNAKNVIGLYGDNAFSALSIIIKDISDRITDDVEASAHDLTRYCGYTTKDICAARFDACKWNGKKCSSLTPTQSPIGTKTPVSAPFLLPPSSPSTSPTRRPTTTPTTPKPTQPSQSTPSNTPTTSKPTSTASPTSANFCPWALYINGQFLNEGAVEATPGDACSSKSSKFGCTSKNYCCWSDATATCSIPKMCSADCPTLADEESCVKVSNCCIWNSDAQVCRRRCMGSPLQVCP